MIARSFNAQESTVNRFEMPQFELPPSFSESYTNAVVEKIRTIEGNLKPDEGLVMYCQTADGRMRVMSLQFTGGHVIYALGMDDKNVECCHIAATSSLQLTCKVIKVAADTKKAAIGFTFPPKS
jgi:hypothetical protein